MHEIIQTVKDLVEGMGYLGIFLMMVIESSFFPFPSEVAMVPAGALSSEGKMNFALAFTAGTLGALVGATINYIIGWKLGAPVIKKLISKYGKYVFLTNQHYDKTEYFFLDHGAAATFLGRLITGIRQIISIPAGVFKMNYIKFITYTGVGAGLWNLILMVIGYVAQENQELIAQYSFIAFIASFIIVGISSYLYFQRRKYPNTEKSSSLILLNPENKILIQERTSISKHGEKWGLFGGQLEYGEKPKHAIAREILEELGMEIENEVKYLGKIVAKVPERHTVAKRSYFYMKTELKIEDIKVLEGDSAKFVTLEELIRLENFSVNGSALSKLSFLIKKAAKKLDIQRKKEEEEEKFHKKYQYDEEEN